MCAICHERDFRISRCRLAVPQPRPVRDKAPSPPKGCSRRDLAFVRPYEPLPVGLDASPGALPSPGHLRLTCAIQAPAIDVALQGARG